MSVVGIGGVFFRANDPAALQAWYEKHLGLVVDYATRNRPGIQLEKLIDLGESVRVRAAHETAADKTDVERAFRAHSRSSTLLTSCARDVPRRLRSRRGQHQSHHGSPSLNGGSLSAGTLCSAIASSMATPT